MLHRAEGVITNKKHLSNKEICVWSERFSISSYPTDEPSLFTFIQNLFLSLKTPSCALAQGRRCFSVVFHSVTLIKPHHS